MGRDGEGDPDLRRAHSPARWGWRKVGEDGAGREGSLCVEHVNWDGQEQ